MANRTASLSDVTFYSSSYPLMTLGDIIIDTPFSTNNGKSQLLSSTLGSSSPYNQARLGANFWISSSLSPIYYISYSNGGNPWNPSTSSENPITFRPLGGRVFIERTDGSNSGFTMQINDIINLCIDGEISGSWGMKYPRETYLKMGFVFRGSGSMANIGGYNSIRSSPIAFPYTSCVIRGVEISQGFSGIRLGSSNSTGSFSKVLIERCYIHDTSDGEGLYFGMTSGNPRPTFYNTSVINSIFARVAKESIQTQQLRSGSGEFKNFVIYAGASKWKDSSLGGGQDNAIQRLNEEGKHTIRNFIIDGYGSSAFILFGYASGSPNYLNRVRTLDGLVNDGRWSGIYVNNPSNGLKWEHRNIYFGNNNNTAVEIDESVNHFISSNNGTDEHLWDKIYKDSSKPSFFQTLSSTYNVPPNSTSSAIISYPTYSNSGFPGKTAEQIEQWVNKQYTPANTSASYNIGDIVNYYSESVNAYFYECRVPHTSSTLSIPPLSPTTWSAILWDINGIPSYWTASYNSESIQSFYPPDDFRLVYNDEWNRKGFGLYGNEDTEDYTNFKWYIADDSNGTNYIQLITENSTRYEKRDKKDIGKYIRLQASFKDQNNNRKEMWVTEWTLVT